MKGAWIDREYRRLSFLTNIGDRFACMGRCDTCNKRLPPKIKAGGMPRRYCNDSCRRKSPARKRYLAEWGVSEYLRQYREDHRAELNAARRDAALQAKLEGIAHYGGKCACCGERQIEFLTMEHKEGRDQTRTRFTGKRAWLEAKRAGWPRNITVMCFNCNCARGAFGYCPHRKRKEVGG